MATESIDKLAEKLAESLPQGLKTLRDDVEKNFRAVLQSSLHRMDLVTREEFEVQSAVLSRTREKLTSLEKRLAELEAGKPARKAAPAKASKKAAKKTTK